MQYYNTEAYANQTCSLSSSPFFTSGSSQKPIAVPSPPAYTSNASLPPHNLTANTQHRPSSSSCQQGATPFYTIEVLRPSHVQSAVAFAAQNNLRLSIKSTGHDVLGRSTAPGSLNLWMHKLKNITFHDKFTPDGCDASATFSAVTAASGTQWRELYDAAHARNVILVGAMTGSVSTGGGFVQGGGHSPLSPFLGLAADNVIEMKVVTADGRIRTANACQNQELFWALRGGGGGTFGVVLSCTHITYPALDTIVNVFINTTSNNATIFTELLTEFVNLQAFLSEENHWAGYSYISINPLPALSLNYFAPNGNASMAQSSFASFLDFATSRSDQITLNMRMNSIPSFQTWHNGILCAANPGICSDLTGDSVELASRLLPRNLLQEHPSQVAQALMEILRNGVTRIIGHLVGGQIAATGQSLAERQRVAGLRRNLDHPKDIVGSLHYSKVSSEYGPSAQNSTGNSVNPAFRKAVWHVVIANSWREQAMDTERHANLTQLNGLLRQLSPGSGCYLNEADMNEPNWQQAFFGDHYSRLKSIKNRVDPEGLFTCTRCVGSEDWVSNDQLICRRPSSN